MEMFAVSARKAVPSTFFSPFSDQSHLQFYGQGRSSFCFKLPPCRCSASSSKIVPTQAFSSNAWAVATEHTSEEALMKELVELKLRMKQKKKELKAQMKEEKKKMKVQMKEERKRKKQKDGIEGKMKMKCESESSSSESCDEECTSVSMKMVRRNQVALASARGNSAGGSSLDDCDVSCSAVSASSVHLLANDAALDLGEFQPSSSSLVSDATVACAGNSSMALTDRESSELFLSLAAMGSFDGLPKNGDMFPCKSRVSDEGLGAAPRAFPLLRATNRIEVCTGGKCKKAGSQQLLTALQGQIPRSADVEAVPCKCMGKCAMAVNVRVLKEDTNPQHHSHVGVEDGSLILSHHFGPGCPPVGLPSLSTNDGMRVPLPLATA